MHNKKNPSQLVQVGKWTWAKNELAQKCENYYQESMSQT